MFRISGRSIGVGWGLLLVLLVVSGCAKYIHPSRPPEVPIVPNASVITARVLQYLGTLQNAKVLKLEVLTVEPLAPELMSLVSPGQIVEALARANFSAQLVGKRIRAVARWAGDEWGQRLWISKIEVLGP